jgi:hypothetical protein
MELSEISFLLRLLLSFQNNGAFRNLMRLLLSFLKMEPTDTQVMKEVDGGTNLSTSLHDTSLYLHDERSIQAAHS